MATTVPERLAHALAEEFGLAGLLLLSDLVAVEKERVLAAAAGAVHLLVAGRALAAVALEWTRVTTGARLGARLPTGRNGRRAVGSGVTGEQREWCCAARAGGDDAGRGRARDRASGMWVALLQAFVDTALVLLLADAVAREAALPGLVGVAAHLALLLVPPTRSNLLLLATVTADGLDLAAIATRAEVTQSAAAVLATG